METEICKGTILIVEDEKGIRNFISKSLLGAGYEILLAENGETAKRLFLTKCPDLILLDLGLPDLDGIELIGLFRGWRQTPIIVVSARDRETEKVKALDLGADDYMTKPFGISELLARVRTALRRQSRQQEERAGQVETYRVKDLVIDLSRHVVTKSGEEIHFTGNEFKSLVLLAKHAGKVLTYDYISRELWGTYNKSCNQTLRVNMTNIRRKLQEDPAEPKYIMTELGIGYRMLEDN